MVDCLTNNLRIRLRAVGSRLPRPDWVSVLNVELDKIDEVIGKVCSPAQIAIIRDRIHSDQQNGVIL